MSKKNWNKINDQLWPVEVSSAVNKIPAAVYTICFSPTSGYYLRALSERFEMPKKKYNFFTEFEERFVKTYKATGSNIGAILNGVKGTGKTIVAQNISNALMDQIGLPVLIIAQKELPQDLLIEFISSIDQDCVIFVDEYEKIFGRYDDTLLTVMDGVMKNSQRRVFLFTSNEASVNSNLLQRPSRLRYFKTFGDLSRENIAEVVKDTLQNVDMLDEVVNCISKFDMITVDIVISFVAEINIHECTAEEALVDFNVNQILNQFNVYLKDRKSGKFSLNYSNAQVDPLKIDSNSLGQKLIVAGQHMGKITHVDGDIVTTFNDDYEEICTFKIESNEYIHRSFTTSIVSAYEHIS